MQRPAVEAEDEAARASRLAAQGALSDPERQRVRAAAEASAAALGDDLADHVASSAWRMRRTDVRPIASRRARTLAITALRNAFRGAPIAFFLARPN
jgi:hypothetical protein